MLSPDQACEEICHCSQLLINALTGHGKENALIFATSVHFLQTAYFRGRLSLDSNTKTKYLT